MILKILAITALIFVAYIVVVIGCCEADDSTSTSSSSSSTSGKTTTDKPKKKTSGSYINSGIHGVPDSMTYVDDESDMVTHVSIDGNIDHSTSFKINDHEKIHYDVGGNFLGSTKEKDGKIMRYDSDNRYEGHSEVHGDRVDHYDWLGLYIGSSKK